MKARLRQINQRLSHPIAIGFDPNPEFLPLQLRSQHKNFDFYDLALTWATCILQEFNEQCGVIKLQSAYFESHGSEGFRALSDISKLAKEKGYYVILDAKRGDIESTMSAYGRWAFETVEADALTILPWMGIDVLKALTPWLKDRHDLGVFTVWLSSNFAGRQIQELPIHNEQRTDIHQNVAQKMFAIWESFGREQGIENQLGYVLGATNVPDWVQKTMPSNQCYLMPGVGAQGATVDAALKQLLKENPSTIIPISRGLIAAESNLQISTWNEYAVHIRSNLSKFRTDCQFL
ncbi:MAG: orotidine-5'-phosphate decarboxylase [Proteobacteria bacterium]|nr:orotidine-5'-phosphate decarboxylase [Pseudomonadota bacterium]